MNQLEDFNNVPHRVRSASVTFQKGVYHLFLLANEKDADQFASLLRLYQCLFQLCLSHLLLDSNFSLTAKGTQKRLRRLCGDPDNPTRNEIDPAALVAHATFEKGSNWLGLPLDHPLHVSSLKARDLLQRVAEARHNLIYRPFLLNDLWEDCTLIELLESKPAVEEVEDAYRFFVSAMIEWHGQYEPVRRAAANRYYETLSLANLGNNPHPIPPVGPAYFLDHVFTVYEDRGSVRPTETLLLTYARMLNPEDGNFLDSLRDYRNGLMSVDTIKYLVGNPDEWRIGEL